MLVFSSGLGYKEPMNQGQSEAELVARACPLCGANDPRPFLDRGSLHLARCRACAMVYATPIQAALASGAFYDRLAVPFYLSPDKLESDYAPVRFERELRLFRLFCRRGRALDVGCSTGAFLVQLKRRHPSDYEVWGTDVAGAALDHAERQGVQVARGSFLEIDFGQRQFDAVTFWAVLEHLERPRAFLDRAGSLLRAGGFCFILVPNLRSLATRLLGARYRYLMPEHVNYFTAGTLRSFALSGGGPFEIAASGCCHFNPVVILQDARGGRERVPDAVRARLLKRTTACKQNPWLRPLKWVYTGAERLLGLWGLADNVYIVLRRK